MIRVCEICLGHHGLFLYRRAPSPLAECYLPSLAVTTQTTRSPRYPHRASPAYSVAAPGSPSPASQRLASARRSPSTTTSPACPTRRRPRPSHRPTRLPPVLAFRPVRTLTPPPARPRTHLKRRHRASRSRRHLQHRATLSLPRLAARRSARSRPQDTACPRAPRAGRKPSRRARSRQGSCALACSDGRPPASLRCPGETPSFEARVRHRAASICRRCYLHRVVVARRSARHPLIYWSVRPWSAR